MDIEVKNMSPEAVELLEQLSVVCRRYGISYYSASQTQRDLLDSIALHEYQLKKAHEQGQPRSVVPPFLGLKRTAAVTKCLPDLRGILKIKGTFPVIAASQGTSLHFIYALFSARGPGHIPAGQDVEVQVVDALGPPAPRCWRPRGSCPDPAPSSPWR